MGFTALHRTVMAGCANVNTPGARAMERVFQNVAMVDVMRTFYKDHRMLQWFLKHRP